MVTKTNNIPCQYTIYLLTIYIYIQKNSSRSWRWKERDEDARGRKGKKAEQTTLQCSMDNRDDVWKMTFEGHSYKGKEEEEKL